jgi:hypothetical protein
LFMKTLTRDRVVPIISASASPSAKRRSHRSPAGSFVDHCLTLILSPRSCKASIVTVIESAVPAR